MSAAMSTGWAIRKTARDRAARALAGRARPARRGRRVARESAAGLPASRRRRCDAGAAGAGTDAARALRPAHRRRPNRIDGAAAPAGPARADRREHVGRRRFVARARRVDARAGQAAHRRGVVSGDGAARAAAGVAARPGRRVREPPARRLAERPGLEPRHLVREGCRLRPTRGRGPRCRPAGRAGPLRGRRLRPLAGRLRRRDRSSRARGCAAASGAAPGAKRGLHLPGAVWCRRRARALAVHRGGSLPRPAPGRRCRRGADPGARGAEVA